MPTVPDVPFRQLPNAWSGLSSHAHVLILIAADPTARQRDLAARLDLTTRTVAMNVADLAAEGYVSVIREGRRNRYTVHRGAALRHPLTTGQTVADLIRFGTAAG